MLVAGYEETDQLVGNLQQCRPQENKRVVLGKVEFSNRHYLPFPFASMPLAFCSADVLQVALIPPMQMILPTPGTHLCSAGVRLVNTGSLRVFSGFGKVKLSGKHKLLL